MRARHLLPLSALLSTAACGGPTERIDRAVGEAVVCGRGPTVEGIDVSQYQATVNWPMVRAAGKRFAIARILHWPVRDTQFERNWREIRANGLIRGAYIYFDPRFEVAAQADVVVRAVGRLGEGDLPVTLDIEQPNPGLPTPARSVEVIRDLAARVEAGTGRAPMIYTGRYYWPNYVRSTEFRDLPLWHAQYTTTQPCPYIADAWRDWAFWQYSSTGRVSGITGNVDLDRFNGSYAELQRLAGFGAMDAGTPRDAAVARDVPTIRDVPTPRDATSTDGGSSRLDVAPADVHVAADVAEVPQADAPSPDVSPETDVVLSAPDVSTPDVPEETDVGVEAPAPPAGCACRAGAIDHRSPVALALAALFFTLRRRRRPPTVTQHPTTRSLRPL